MIYYPDGSHDPDDEDSSEESSEHWWQTDNAWETAHQVADAVGDIITHTITGH
jgi:hypothetical protein